MAATNFTPIQLYHSTTASAVPVNTNLVNGELAINITDGKLYYKDGGGTVQVIATKATGTIGGATTQVQYNSSGALAGSANFTFDGTTATINTLNLTNALGAAYGGTAQSTYAQGDLLYASAANTLAKLGIGISTYILTSNGTIPGWSAPSAVSIGTATNLAGGAAGSVPYQSGAGVTTFLSIGTVNQVVTSTGSAPQWSSGLSITTLTASDAVTFSATTQNIALGTSQTSGTFTIGGAAQTGTQTIDQSTKTHTLNIGAGATESGATKTVNLATAGVSGSTTTMGVGSAVSGAITNLTVNATTTLAPVARSTGAVSYFTVTTPADTGLTASTEVIGSSFTAATRTWATGALTLQRERVFAAPTYAFAGASTITTAVNVDIGLPVAGTNATITNAYALRAADSLFTGPTIVDVNSASAALRITQVGAGNALLVEDSTNPDSTPFVVDAAGNVGIGTSSPNAPLTFASATGRKVAFFPATQGYSIGVESSEFRFVTDSSAVFSWRNGSTYSTATEYMRLDASGNLGLGVTPSAWSTAVPAFQIGAGGSFVSAQGSVSAVYIGTNAYYNGGWKYTQGTYRPSYYAQNDGEHRFYTAPSGTASTSPINATALTSAENGNSYTIAVAGTTDFTLIGAANNNVGTTFTKSGATGAGTGTVTQNIVFTQAMTLDASGNLGVGTTSPIYDLQIGTYGTDTDSTLALATTSTGTGSIRFGDGTSGSAANAGLIRYDHSVDAMLFWTAVTERARIDSAGTLILRQSSNVANTSVSFNTTVQNALTLDSAAKLTLNAGANTEMWLNTSASGYLQIGQFTNGAFIGTSSSDVNAGVLRFGTAGATQMRLDTSGNLGLGVTPSDWQTGGKFQVGAGQTIGSVGNGLVLASNWYYNTTNKFAGTGYASYYNQVDGVHSWHTSTTSGSIGNNAVLSQAMTLDASGRLGIGTTSPGSFDAVADDLVIGSGSGNFGATIYSSTTGKGTILFADGLAAAGADSYRGFVEYDHSGNFLRFGTDATERARITSGGYFKASDNGTYNSGASNYHEFNQSAALNALEVYAGNANYNANVVIALAARNTTNNSFYYFGAYNTGVTAFKFRVADSGDVTNTNGTYGTIPSERRFKQDIIDAPSQWDDIKNIRLRKFRLKSDVERDGDAALVQLGVIVDELEQVSPGLIDEHPIYEDREVTDDAGNVTKERVQVDTVKGWKTSIVHLKALKALQEAMARIEKLEAEVAALKGA